MPVSEVGDWQCTDWDFGTHWDYVMSDVKRLQAGFTGTVDSEDMFRRLLRQFRWRQSTVKSRDPARRHAQEIQRQADKIADHSRKITGTAIASGRGDGTALEVREARFSDPPDQFDILHYWPVGVATKAPEEIPMDQQPLIAIRQSETDAPPVHDLLETPRRRAVIIQREGENRSTLTVSTVGHESRSSALPTAFKRRIGMQEQQPFAPRRQGAGPQLRAAPAFRRDDQGASCPGPQPGVIRRSAIADHDLQAVITGSRCLQGAKRRPDPRGGVQSRNDNRQTLSIGRLPRQRCGWPWLPGR